MRGGIAVCGRVHDQCEILRTSIAQRTTAGVGKAGSAKPRDEDRGSIGTLSQRLGSARDTLVDRHCDSALPASHGHSAFMPANRMTLPHFSVSSAMSLLNAAGERAISTQPSSSNFAFIAGSARTALISRLSL